MVVAIIQIGLGSVVGFVAFVGLGIGGLYLASRGYEKYRLMTGVVPTEIAALEPGLAEVTGTVVSAGETLRSPIDDTECVAYSHSRETYSDDGSTAGWLWRRLVEWGRQFVEVNYATETVSVPFYVEDATGRVFVDGMKADFALKKDGSRTRGDGPYSRNSDVQYTHRREHVLEPGDSVYVFGEAFDGMPELEPADGLLAEGLRTVTDAIPISSDDKRNLAEAFRDAMPDLPEPLDGEFVITDGESIRELLVSDSSERASQRRQFLRVVMFAGGGVFLFFVAILTVVGTL